MRAVFGLVLIVGIALAGFAVYMTRGYLSTYQTELNRERALRSQAVATEEIYIAAAKIEYGDVITTDMVKRAVWPIESMPEGVFFTESELFPDGLEEPRIALRTIEIHEPLMQLKMTEPGQDAGVAMRLTPGMRAFAIRVDVSTGVSGFLRPNDRVDVYWTGRLPGRDGEATKLIESAITIVAVDQTTDSERRSAAIARTITVEATPEQVAALATAQSTGQLSLALVGYNDDTLASDIQIDKKTLLGIEEDVVVAEEAKRVCTIRTRRNGELIETPIPCKD